MKHPTHWTQPKLQGVHPAKLHGIEVIISPADATTKCLCLKGSVSTTQTVGTVHSVGQLGLITCCSACHDL